ncbi:farnesol dehydrogenase (NAD(+)) [Salvia divinorum]|uniref:Farnesol dehydrogenase (NAD(+)) n=1 Tax=Salvia divinorum TaxID=28513 RepID=A0ABD1GSA1_SALDI
MKKAVLAFVRKTSDVSSLPPPYDAGDGSLQLVYGDVTDYPSLLEAFSGCHVVFHAAALVEPWLPDPARFISVNVGGLRNVLKAYKETEAVEKIVYTSSIFALGPTDGYIADESQVHPAKHFCTEYEKSKTVSDKIALDAAAEGVPIVPLYPGFIYGPGKVTTGNIVAQFLVERFSGRMPGYVGQGQRFSFCHVDDVVQGHIAALAIKNNREAKTTLFFVIYEIYFLVGSSTHSLYAFCIEQAVDVLRHQWAYSCEKAKKELDYNPRSLREGLSEMVPWLQSLGLIKY